MEGKKSEDGAKAKKPYVKPTITKVRKPYEKPTITKLTPEQAKLKLLGAVTEGDEGAKELLEMMFPEVPPKNPKKSA
jgi:hypothetical protein